MTSQATGFTVILEWAVAVMVTVFALFMVVSTIPLFAHRNEVRVDESGISDRLLALGLVGSNESFYPADRIDHLASRWDPESGQIDIYMAAEQQQQPTLVRGLNSIEQARWLIYLFGTPAWSSN